MAVCPNCRSEVEATHAFCHACGLPLKPHAWQSAPPPGTAPAVAGAPGPYAMAPRNDGGAIASMVLGILGLAMLPVIASLVAIVLGYGARGRIRSDRGLGGEGFATAGIVTGWIGVILPLLAGLLFLALRSGY